MALSEAVILAAGLSTRLRKITRGLPKQALKLLGAPLIAYPVACLYAAGVRKFHVVVNPITAKYISDIFSTLDLKYDTVVNDTPGKGNGYSFILGLSLLESKYAFLSMSDHIFHPHIPFRLLEVDKEYDLLVGVDSSPRLVSLEEATKVYVSPEGRVLDIGKNIEKYTHVDIGLFVVSRNIEEECLKYARQEKKVELSSLIKYISNIYRVYAKDVEGLPWIDVDTPEDLKKATSRAEFLLSKVIECIPEIFCKKFKESKSAYIVSLS